MSHPDGRLPEREIAELERAETAIENALVESADRGVETAVLVRTLRGYANTLESMGQVPTMWGESDDR